MSELPLVTIYTDGACEPNPGVGGYAAVLMFGTARKVITGSASVSTNNQMELMAVLEALKALKKKCRVKLHSDSMYVVDGMTKWIHNWKETGWKNRLHKPVKNFELWKEIERISNEHEIEWIWVKAHNGDPVNEECDILAVQAIEKQREMDRLNMYPEQQKLKLQNG